MITREKNNKHGISEYSLRFKLKLQKVTCTERLKIME